MRPLIVIGATESIKDLLHERFADTAQILHADGPDRGLTLVAENPNAIVAYGPGVFGAAVTRQPARVHTDEPQMVLTDMSVPDELAKLPLEDPRRQLDGARVALRAFMVLNVTIPGCLETIAEALRLSDPWPEVSQ